VATAFGSELRQWRRSHGLSQLDLAALADVSQRHISFMESGRSRPSPEMVIHLAGVLEIPPREQNLLLNAAGHAAAYSEMPLEDLHGVEEVLGFMLAAHEPHPAIVVNRQWDVVRSNNPASRFTSLLLPKPPSWAASLNVMRLTFHPDGLRQHIVDWEAGASRLLRRLERDVARHPNDPELGQLLEEIRGYPGVRSLGHSPRPLAGDLLVPITYRVGGDVISLFTTIAIIGDAHDLTLAELRLETFWPVDEESKHGLHRLLAD
jgi:transcriptional regulator with XRE-family HTH domain